ncbi:head-tail joining protein [Photobacterium leiognathi]|uniref:head-tail joining protein n=1 Tax=Photobacterium leiognathi TaxID=553611 RepID=UPI00020880CB|nr:head-tail joining protein [Photobacterium leiognathi]PSW48338.1 hypothetical protein CTM83_20100 [Photobacterium leiognathi subsp. mandapamensis]GAA03227.1 hypothetical protein PMSV_4153 [Photobacterium leiognathi subsp. mandapamensis svers.1.1.]
MAFDFEATLAKADNIIMDTFGNVSVYIGESTDAIRAIFDDPMSKSALSAGGQIEYANCELSAKSHDVATVQRRTNLKLVFDKTKITLSYIVENVYPDGSGMTRIVLEKNNGNQQRIPTLQY